MLGTRIAKTRVLLVNASALERGLLSLLIRSADDLEVSGGASDVKTAEEMLRSLNPDVVVLDADMQGDGIEFNDRVLRIGGVPALVVFGSAATRAQLKVRDAKLVSFIGQPHAISESALAGYAEELTSKIRDLCQVNRNRGVAEACSRAGGVAASAAGSVKSSNAGPAWGGKIVFVGASTGGTEALKTFLLGMPADCPPVLVVQHMPENFTASFARRLDSLCAARVIEACGGEKLEGGTVYIAPGHSHLKIRRNTTLITELDNGPPVNRHRPSVDVLFDSAAEIVGKQAVAVILTGMGKDGSQGLLRLRRAGARTFGQDEASCVVYGMPREAFLLGAVEEQVSLAEMASKVLASLGRT